MHIVYIASCTTVQCTLRHTCSYKEYDTVWRETELAGERQVSVTHSTKQLVKCCVPCPDIRENSPAENQTL